MRFVNKVNIQENKNLADYTSFKIGGNARFFTQIHNHKELESALEFAYSNNVETLILGGGSNLIISDMGFDGLVIKMDNACISIDKDNNIVNVEAGFNLQNLINECIINSLGGLENMSGIPGTVGGAVRGNAGAYGTEMSDVIISVTYYDNGSIKTIPNGECNFSYRESMFKKNSSKIILSASLCVSESNKNKLQEKSREIIQLRNDKQPLEYPNAGSFFKNPIITDDLVPDIEEMPRWKIDDNHTKLSAAWLIERAGLKGYRINDAGISEKHSLFIVNYGKAKTSDIIQIMKRVQKEIKEKFNIELYPEPQLVGFD